MNIWAASMITAGGLFAGGAATFAWSRVPIWRRMSLPDFVRDFSQTIEWTDRVQPVLLVAAILSTGGYALTSQGPARLIAAVAAAGFVLVLAGSVTFMVPLQRRLIASPLLEAEAMEHMRMRWFRGNLGRSILATASFLAAATAAAIGA